MCMKGIAGFFKKYIWAFLNTHRQFFMVLYALIYCPWFVYLENHVTTHYHIIHVPLDDMIPFCEFFVIPYYLWFVYMGVSMIFIALFDGPTCYKMGLFLITGMTVFLIVSTVYPNGQDLRPDLFVRDNFCVDLVRKMYAADTPTNVLPSLHVYNSIGMHLALCASPRLARRPVIKRASGILMILIILSTVFIRQHSVVDVFSACAMAAIMYLVSYVIIPHLSEAKQTAVTAERKF